MLPNQAGGRQDDTLVLIVVMLVVLAIALTIQIFYLLTLSRALGNCRPENRTMEPGMVWLNLIPCLNIVWIFVTVVRIAESLRNEFRARRLPGDENFGQSLGIAYNVLSFCGAIPFIGGLFSIAALVCFIMYWVKIAGFSRQLRETVADYSNDYPDSEKYRGVGEHFRDSAKDDDRYRGSGDGGYQEPT